MAVKVVAAVVAFIVKAPTTLPMTMVAAAMMIWQQVISFNLVIFMLNLRRISPVFNYYSQARRVALKLTLPTCVGCVLFTKTDIDARLGTSMGPHVKPK